MAFGERLTLALNPFSQRGHRDSTGEELPQISTKSRNRIIAVYRMVFSGQLPSDQLPSVYRDNRSAYIDELYNLLCISLGRTELSMGQFQYKRNELIDFISECHSLELLDFIELSFHCDSIRHTSWNEVVRIVNDIFHNDSISLRLTQFAWNALPRRPTQFYQFYSVKNHPKLVWVEEDIVHEDAIIPALSILQKPHFLSADQEYRDALDEFRIGDYGDCLTKCNCAIESVMKVICKKSGWPYPNNPGTKRLLDIMTSKSVLDNGFKEALVLIANLRNEVAHGGGDEVRRTEKSVAQFALTLSAAAIILLVEKSEH